MVQKARWVKIIVAGLLGCPEAHAKSRNSQNFDFQEAYDQDRATRIHALMEL